MKYFILFFSVFFSSIFAQTTIETDPIPNVYAKVTEIDYCTNSMQVTTGAESQFSPGDRVLIIQMKNAALDVSDSPNNGNVVDFRSAGNYEINEVRFIGFAGALSIQFEYNIARQYNASFGLQIVKIPQYNNVDFQVAELTCLPWDGNIGGILIVEAQGNINLNSNVNVDGKGFRGGNTFTVVNECYNNVTGEEFEGYDCFEADRCGAYKGEGIGLKYELDLTGRGRDGNGGGGGANDNGGGGGGSNVGLGGIGGANDNVLTGFCEGSGGGGGTSIDYTAINKIFMGGGGGAGYNGNGQSTNGQNGGGIVYFIAESITTNGFQINAFGNDVAVEAGGDGAGGGGGGGAVILDIDNYNDNLIIDAKGGKGGDIFDGTNCPGLGGGGGGGLVWIKSASEPNQIVENLTGGIAGTHLSNVCDGVTFGVSGGTDGAVLTNFEPIIADVTYSRFRITSAERDDTICIGESADLAATLSEASHPFTFNWNYSGDSITADLNTTVEPTTRGVNTYTATINATIFDQVCELTENVFITVRNPSISIVTSPDTALNEGDVVFLNSVVLPTNPDYIFNWSPADLVEPNDGKNALAEPFQTTEFCLTVIDEIGCEKTECVEVEVQLPYVGAPTAFTPNGDDLNETFRVIPDPALKVNALRVYNRWGQVIYNSTELFEWDGNYNSKKQPNDNYFWSVEVERINTGEVEVQSGVVAIIR